MVSPLRFYEQGAPNYGRRKDFYLSQLARVEQDAVDEAYGMAFYVVDAMVQAIAAAGERASSQVVAFGEALETQLTSMRGSMLRLHEGVAEKMQTAVVGAYLARLATSRNPQGYRAGASDHSKLRYANGVLLQALRSPEFIRATYDGIAFPNISLLDSRAAQWHRLNFGAGGAAGASNRLYSEAFGGLVLTALGFGDESPSAPFSLPTGSWSQGGAFYPATEGYGGHGFRLHKGPTPTKGIQAWNFLDAGVKVMADLLPQAYSKRITELVELADKGRGAYSRITSEIIKPPAGGFAGQQRSRAVR